MSFEESNAEFGRIAIRAVDAPPRASFGRLVPRGEAAAEGAKVGAIVPPVAGLSSRNPFMTPYGVMVGILLAPLTTIAGTVYGALAAPSATAIERAVLSLEAVTRDANLPNRFRDVVISRLNQAHAGKVLMGVNGEAESADTTVEIWLSDVVFLNEGISQELLSLRVSGGMRILKAGIEMRFVPIKTGWEHRHRHTLTTWAAADGQQFREELRDALNELADDVVYGLLCCPLTPRQ